MAEIVVALGFDGAMQLQDLLGCNCATLLRTECRQKLTIKIASPSCYILLFGGGNALDLHSFLGNFGERRFILSSGTSRECVSCYKKLSLRRRAANNVT